MSRFNVSADAVSLGGLTAFSGLEVLVTFGRIMELWLYKDRRITSGRVTRWTQHRRHNPWTQQQNIRYRQRECDGNENQIQRQLIQSIAEKDHPQKECAHCSPRPFECRVQPISWISVAIIAAPQSTTNWIVTLRNSRCGISSAECKY